MNNHINGLHLFWCFLVSLLFFSKDGFGIKQPEKVDMPLNRETQLLNNKNFLKFTKDRIAGVEI